MKTYRAVSCVVIEDGDVRYVVTRVKRDTVTVGLFRKSQVRPIKTVAFDSLAGAAEWLTSYIFRDDYDYDDLRHTTAGLLRLGL